MKKFIIAILFLVPVITLAQEKISEKTSEFYVDFSKSANGRNVQVPQITWIAPAETLITTQDRRNNIQISIQSDSKIESILIYINGEPMDQSRGFTIEEEKDHFRGDVEKDIFLSHGQNEVEVVVRNEDGGMAVDRRTIFLDTNDDELIASRRDRAIFFATDKYDYWSNLVNPVNDARTIAKELKRYYGFEIEIVENGTVDEVMAKFQEYARKSYMDNDQLFIFFAGHGHFDESFREGYVVAKNSLKNDVGKTSYISHSNLRTIINNIPCKHTLLSMDVCFGGTFDQSIAQAGYRGGDGDNIYQELTPAEYINRKLEYKTRLYLTSGGKEYVPDGRPGHHSPFARKFLEALRNFGGNDKILTKTELMLYMEKILPQPMSGEFGDNEPGSDFLFVYR